MRVDNITISSYDIKNIESLLFKENETFNIERCDFISNLDTVDLHAVPGSGKTTALLAKLLILEKKLPFSDGSGILVLSHTNAAVDEIKNRIGKYCPNLFSYPNYVGTIQGFVDRFLAIPFYVNQFKTHLYSINSDVYVNQVEKYYENLIKGRSPYIDKKYDPIKYLAGIRFNSDAKLVEGVLGKIADFKPQEITSTYKRFLYPMKKKLLIDGYLHFEDAYSLAYTYIDRYPNIISILQKRFRFVFVDEMQDMEFFQSNLLEKLFFKKKIKRHIFQRIGDNNQAIFSNRNNKYDNWKSNSRKILKLNGSYRLNEKISKIAEQFSIDKIDINGLNTDSNIKPKLILFDNPGDVLESYCNIIHDHNLSDDKYPFCAVGWTSQKDEDSKLCIKNYFNDFEKASILNKKDYINLEGYISKINNNEITFPQLRKIIIRAILQFLKLINTEEVKQENGRLHNTRTLLLLLKENHEHEYLDLKLHIYKWSLKIINEEVDSVKNEVVEYLKVFLNNVFGLSELNQSAVDFLNDVTQNDSQESQVNENIYSSQNFDKIKIQVGTVHSAKGKTHTATLYFETFYERACLGGNYESQRLIKPISCQKNVSELLNDENFVNGVLKRGVLTQSARMMYVGFSRPTHLLCFAAHKDRIDITNELKSVWDIIDLS